MNKDQSLQDFHKELQQKAARLSIPIFGGFELTPRCNLSCKMCYVRRSGLKPHESELTAQQWIELGHEAADNGALNVFITGGEPLLRPDFKEIYEAYCKLGFRLSLFTNGTLLTDELAKWLSSIPPATVDVTLYGTSENTYYNLCGVKEAYGMAVGGIELLLENGIHTRIKTTVVKTNLVDYEGIKAFAKSYNVDFLGSSLIHGNRENGIADCAAQRLSPEEIYELDIDNIDEYDCKPVDIDKIKAQFKDLPVMACSAARTSFFINWKGQLTPCPLFEIPYTNPLRVGFKNAWDGLREKITEIPAAKKCQACEKRAFCPVCPPRLYLETGRFDQHSEYLCALADIKEKFVNKQI